MNLYPFDARGIGKRFRHAAIFGALDALTPGETMRFFNDHDPVPLLRQMEQLGLGNVKFFGGDALCTEKLPELSGKTPALKNVTCATGGASVDKMQGGSDWKKRYDAKFPGQFQIYSPYAYDAAMVLADAMKRANSVDPKVFTPFLAKTEYKGVTANIAFTAKGELTTPAVTLYTFKDGSRVALN